MYVVNQDNTSTFVQTPRACVSVDLDPIRSYADIHGLRCPEFQSDADTIYQIGVPRMLTFFEEMGISATLFVVGEDALKKGHHDVLKRAANQGHELGNHSFSHDYALGQRPISEQHDDLERCEDAIAAISGRKPVGFRAPGYNLNATLLNITTERKYLYGSSIFPCPPYYVAKAAIMSWMRLNGRESRSKRVPVETLLTPLEVYRPSTRYLWRHNPMSIAPLEIPMCVVPKLRFPIIGTSLHLLQEKGFARVYPSLKSRYTKILNLEFHAIDFMDANDADVGFLKPYQPDLSIAWSEKRRLYARAFQKIRQDYVFSTLEHAVITLDSCRVSRETFSDDEHQTRAKSSWKSGASF